MSIVRRYRLSAISSRPWRPWASDLQSHAHAGVCIPLGHGRNQGSAVGGLGKLFFERHKVAARRLPLPPQSRSMRAGDTTHCLHRTPKEHRSDGSTRRRGPRRYSGPGIEDFTGTTCAAPSRPGTGRQGRQHKNCSVSAAGRPGDGRALR